jgi:hypothetical protein
MPLHRHQFRAQCLARRVSCWRSSPYLTALVGAGELKRASQSLIQEAVGQSCRDEKLTRSADRMGRLVEI